MTSTDRVLIILTSHDTLGDTGRSTGFYVSEAAEPWQILTETGITVDLVSVRGGRPPMNGLDEADPTQREFLADPRIAATLADTPTPSDIDPTRYRGVLYAGGHGTMWDFPGNEQLTAISRAVYESGGVVAAVCHGPAGLVDLTLSDGAHLVRGRRVAAFTNEEEAAVGLSDVVPFLLSDRLAARGALLIAAPAFTPNVITDGRLITGQNPQSAAGVARAMAAALNGPHMAG